MKHMEDASHVNVTCEFEHTCIIVGARECEFIYRWKEMGI